MGTISVWYKNICLANAELYAMHDVDEEGIIDTQQITEEKGTNPVSLLKTVAVIVCILVVLLFGRKLIFRMIRKSQIRRHKAERRRRR